MADRTVVAAERARDGMSDDEYAALVAAAAKVSDGKDA